jgi:protein phosphatase
MKVEVPVVTGLRYGALTDPGKVREVNEDRALIEPWPDGSAVLIVIADGMGGQYGGAVAAQTVVDVFRTLLGQPLHESRFDRYESLLGCFYSADEAIKSRASTNVALLNMGSTVIASIITASECLFLYAGDCRFYHFRKDSKTFVTSDHSVVSILIETGRLAPEDAASHPMRAVVTSSLGASANNRLCVDPKWDEMAPLQSAFRNLLPDDRLLFCSDGLSSELEPECLAALADDYNLAARV